VENLPESSVLLGYLAGGVHIIGFLIYNWKIINGSAKPNTATWALWAFIAGLNAATYDTMSGDRIKAILSIASGIACLLTFLFALVSGKFKKLDVWDKRVLTLGIIAAGVWFFFKSASYANLLLQGALLISFLPLFKSVWQDPSSEGWLPWVIWVGAYTLSIITVIMRWKGHILDIAYPINGFVLHGIVAWLSLRR